MADIRAFLTEQGLSKEEVDAIVGNDKSAKAMTAALSRYDEGSALSVRAAKELEDARTERTEAAEFWEQKVTPALATVDRRVAQAESEKARYAAYLQSLKNQGYDVPADLLTPGGGGNPNPGNGGGNPGNGNYMTREQMAKEFEGTGATLVRLQQVTNEYQDLYGRPYLTAEADYADARKQGRPFSEYVREKYKFSDKTAERTKKQEDERIAQMVEEKYKAREAELSAKYGSNPELRSPVSSKFDRLEKLGVNKDAWKTEAGKKASKEARLSRFENLTLQ